MTEPSESAAESTSLAWEHLYSSSSPGLRRWLTTGQPVALHQDMLMVAVPNIFTRNQLENRFRSDIESLLSGYFGRHIQLAVIVDESLKPDEESLVEESSYDSGIEQGNSAESNSGTNHNDRRGENYRDDYTEPGFTAEGLPSAEQYARRALRGEGGVPVPAPRSQAAEAESGYPNRDVYRDMEGFRPRRESDSRLNPKYTFETFVIGGSNR
ncbi:MAG TPA: chromosomal replication initiation protein DnaA, partial [Propionibacteriaceae bacterium]|nr:chromosomal replication initiation protein DnaA [Propionibacteriaceae bacterium]